MIWTCCILGKPTTKKNHARIVRNRATGLPFILQSKQAVAWERSAVLQLKSAWRRPPLTMPVTMSAVVYRERATGDLLNYLAAISDALEKAGVVEDDRLVASLDGCRLEKDAKRPRVEVTISEMR